MTDDQKQLDQLLQQGYRVTSVHQEATGTFNIRLVYTGDESEKHDRYRSMITQDQEQANRAAELQLESESTF